MAAHVNFGHLLNDQRKVHEHPSYRLYKFNEVKSSRSQSRSAVKINLFLLVHFKTIIIDQMEIYILLRYTMRTKILLLRISLDGETQNNTFTNNKLYSFETFRLEPTCATQKENQDYLIFIFAIREKDCSEIQRRKKPHKNGDKSDARGIPS